MRDEKQAKEQWINIVQYCNSVCTNTGLPVVDLGNHWPPYFGWKKKTWLKEEKPEWQVKYNQVPSLAQSLDPPLFSMAFGIIMKHSSLC